MADANLTDRVIATIKLTGSPDDQVRILQDGIRAKRKEEKRQKREEEKERERKKEEQEKKSV